MDFLNWPAIIVAAIVPTIIGALWYGPIFGKQWLASTGKTEEYFRENGNMPVNMAASFALSMVLAFAIKALIELTHGVQFQHLSDEIVGSFHTFKHGALHGLMFSAFFIFPFFIINGLFELRGAKNYWIHIGYWLICCTLMGGILDWWV